jgi:hypothetical protein
VDAGQADVPNSSNSRRASWLGNHIRQRS